MIKSDVNKDILLSFINDYFGVNKYHGIVALKITHINVSTYHKHISFFFDYESLPGWTHSRGSTSYKMPMEDYKIRSRNLKLESILE
jgi:hypothetical protein